jgi:hypothetical protein
MGACWPDSRPVKGRLGHRASTAPVLITGPTHALPQAARTDPGTRPVMDRRRCV